MAQNRASERLLTEPVQGSCKVHNESMQMSSNNQTSSGLELDLDLEPGMESYQCLSNTRRYSSDDPVILESQIATQV